MGGVGSTDVPGFERNRDAMVLRLRRMTTGTAADEGIYWCSVNDDEEIYHTIYVGLYNTGGGMLYII